MQLNRVQGLDVTSPGHLTLLGDVRGNNLAPFPVVVDVSLPAESQAPPIQGQPVPVEPSDEAKDVSGATESSTSGPYSAIRLASRGERRDYALEPRPLKSGGQAQVTRANHKPTSASVAFKKLRMTGNDQRARLRREVDAAGMFATNRHVMPVLDYSPAHDWLVMPLADYSAEDMAASLRDDIPLLDLITAICEGLREAHQSGWIHRDLKPANILWLDGRWVVADWGLGRRPRGQTTAPGRTRSGVSFGSEGYAAPELHTDAHEAGPQADIYSIGQIIGWALLQTEPRANMPHLPPAGPWLEIVRAATQLEPDRRPASVDELLSLIAAQFNPPAAIGREGTSSIAARDADTPSDHALELRRSDAPSVSSEKLSEAQLLVRRNRAHIAQVEAERAEANASGQEVARRYAQSLSLITSLWEQLGALIATETNVDLSNAPMVLSFDDISIEFLRIVEGRHYPAQGLPPLMWAGEIKARVRNAMFGEATLANLVVLWAGDSPEIKVMQFEEETHDPAGSRERLRLPRALNSHFMPREYMEHGAHFGGDVVTDEVATPGKVLEIVMEHVQQIRSWE
jgi:serine/threonine protein kinase